MARLLPLVMRTGFLVLCLELSGCWALWRYRTNTGDYFIFSTRTTIYLEYKGTSFEEWEVPSLCAVHNKRAPETTLHCSVPGTHQIRPVVKIPSADDVERFLSINADVSCFMWYIKQSNNSSSKENPYQFIDIWIFDPENADLSELNHTATSPSVYSRTLSQHFWNLGQTPVITTFFGRQYTENTFYDGKWTFEVPSLTNDNIARISGRTITFQDCFVVDTHFVFAQPIFTLGFENDTSISLPAGSAPIVAWAACYPATAVLVTDFGTFHTSDGFLTSEEIKFPAHLIERTLIHNVKEVAIIFPVVFILIKDKLYKVTEDQIFGITDNRIIPNKNIIGIRGKTWCSADYPLTDRLLSEIIIWTKNEVYIGFSNDEYHPLVDTMLLKDLLRLRRSIDLLIISACYDSLTATVAVLLECTGCMATKVLYLAAYNEGTAQWILRDFSLTHSATGTMHMEVASSAQTTMLLWDDDKIFYTYNDNKINGFLKVAGTDKIFSAASEGSTIHQIIIDYGRNTIIKLKNNVMFFLKFEMNDAVKLVTWEKANQIFYCNPAGDMYLVTINAQDIKRQIYPLKLEIFSAAWRLQEVCPYISFEHNMNLNIYYLDMGEKLTFWAQIVFLENLGLSTEIEVYRPDLLRQKTHLHYEIVRGICTKNQTITFSHENDYSEMLEYRSAITTSQGIMTVELQSSSTGKTCTSKSKLTHIRVGCPPEKELRIVEKPSDCEDFAFSIPRTNLRNQQDKKDLEIFYDLDSYGCPIEAYYGDHFRPTVALYIHDTFWNIVETNYILWEMNGRTDFTYNTTMQQAGCLHKAQTWHSMIGSRNKTIELTVEQADEIWGPHNYKSCFNTDNEDLRDLKEPYEILNHSGINSIVWSPLHTGIYMFMLKIVDPNFSFCNMTVLFAVHTVGVIERPSWLLIAGWSMMILTLFLGVLVFSYFSYVRTFRKLTFVDPLLSFHANVNATKESKKE